MAINPHSESWVAARGIAEAKIEQLRNALERDADEATTTRLRAKLHAYRDVLTWPDYGRDEPAEGSN